MSSINTGSININYPLPGVNQNSQGFRDNFTSIKSNLDIAASELTDLQNKAILKSALDGSTLNNDCGNTLISNALTSGFCNTTYNLGNNLFGSVTVDIKNGDVQYGTITANTTLSFSNWPPIGSYYQLVLFISVSSTSLSSTLTFPTTVDTQSMSTVENSVGRVVSFPASVTTLGFILSTRDCGANVTITPLNRPRRSTQLSTAIPATLVGAVGDRAGTVAVDSNYIYVCTANYDGTTQIWKRAVLTAAGFVISSDDISFLQSGTGSISRSVQSKLRERVSILDFAGVDPTGSTDSTAGIQAAITYAKTLTAPELIVDYGTYLVSNKLVFDLPNNSTITFLGKIRSSVSADPAIRIGSSSTNTFGLTVTGIKVERISIDTSAGSTGVELRNLAGCMVDVRWCFNFNFGIVAFGDQANGGFSYNEIHMGLIHDNKTNLYLTASGAGYCNENNFYGGSFNHSSSFPAGLPTVNLLINHFPTSTLNNNRFYGPSFEDNSLLAVAAVLNGDNNVIYWPRMENAATLPNYQIQFAVNARECRVIGNSYGMLYNSNISDLGTGNMYETREGTVMRYQTGTAPGNAVLKLQGYFTGSAKALSVIDPASVERAYITGDGDAWFQRAVTIAGVPAAGTAGALTLGTGTQSTVGAAGGASALPATPLGYLRVWIGTTEVAIPYYNKV